MASPTVSFEHSYAHELPGLYTPWQGQQWPKPQLVLLNERLAQALGLDPAALTSVEGVAMLSGHAMPDTARPLAMAYAGHQFGGFSAQLGDGRAILVGEVIDPQGKRWDLHLKGSGQTPFARGGDGRAVLGPVLREYMISEAMAALGVPTTRALAACTTGERILRQRGLEPGAVLARVAASHLRVGTFQFLAARGDNQLLQRLADYAISRHDPDLTEAPHRYLKLLARVSARQAQTVAHWMGIGFVHGVMNTDNTTISGETIDYGPCAFMERYDPQTCFSSIDHQGRYAYGNQPAIIFWNLARLAETLLPLINTDEDRAIEGALQVIKEAQTFYRAAWLQVFTRKLGLNRPDAALIEEMHQLWQGQGVDFTSFFRALPAALGGDEAPLRALFDDDAAVGDWLAGYRALASNATPELVARNNPVYIPRNQLVEEALQAASFQDDMEPFRRLLALVQAPFTHVDSAEAYARPAPHDAPQIVTYCGT
ncbi:protein adenylyltransferase SelO [Desulfurivibrio alkaliphilus]|uniref:Protein nucleotidyltransferase YdiU n=1 Tax=Desulfurivibrio alkaliphilus (strain DSM 19089 / UNIQEM U267 / AHT2) TaxID=589865 RepID=D6Z5Z8_DESAT|nr:YdiU family protein [Desulfurivibrio alkaliphilus]ADH84880.1 protein of unknown function UPF0061 [Desulfurivibrio alkaliphilus AHT 2]